MTQNINFQDDDNNISKLNMTSNIQDEVSPINLTQHNMHTESHFSKAPKGKKPHKYLHSLDLGDQFKTTINFTTHPRNLEHKHSSSQMNSKVHIQVVKHLYKHHLITEKTNDHRLQLLKIYFILRTLKNPYLSYFLLLDFANSSMKDKYLQRNKKILIKKYL